MKNNTNFRRPATGWLVALRALVFLALAIPLQAQQLQSAAQNEQNITWLNHSLAQVKLQNELQQQHLQLPGLPPNSTAHTDVLRRIAYYKAILRVLQENAPLPLALEKALPAAATVGGQYENSFTPKTVLRSLYEEARSLLSN